MQPCLVANSGCPNGTDKSMLRGAARRRSRGHGQCLFVLKCGEGSALSHKAKEIASARKRSGKDDIKAQPLSFAQW